MLDEFRLIAQRTYIGKEGEGTRDQVGQHIFWMRNFATFAIKARIVRPSKKAVVRLRFLTYL